MTDRGNESHPFRSKTGSEKDGAPAPANHGFKRKGGPPAQASLDTNIDHRRVPNLMVFFQRKGQSLSLNKRDEFLPGDIVSWMLPSGRDHIGMVTDQKTWFGRYKVEHNIGDGPKIEDVLFAWKITGHYRYRPS